MKRNFYLALLAALALSSQVWAAGLSMSGDELEFDMQTNLGVAKGNVVLVYKEGRATGDYAQFNSKTNSGYLQGNVVADKDGYHITADTMTVHDDDHTSASGNAVLTKDGRVLKAKLIDYYKSTQFLQTGNGRATLTDVDGSTVEADEINYSQTEGVAKANGNVQIKSEVRKLTASADHAVYRLHDDSSTTNYLELIGNAKATQDGNTVRGNPLKLNNAKIAQADGKVTIFYTPKQKAKVQATPEQGAAPKAEEKSKKIRNVASQSEAAEEA